MKKFKTNALIFTILLVFPLMLITTNAFCGSPNPPTGEEHLAGPAIVGHFTFSPVVCDGAPFEQADNDCGVSGTFLGSCKGQPVEVGFTYEDVLYDDITAENLKWWRLGDLGPPGCRSEFGGEFLIINAVTRFVEQTEPERMKECDVVILYVVGKGN